MNMQKLLAAVTLALAGSAALAGELTVVNDNFAPMRSRADVKAEVLRARAAGITQFATEFDAVATPAAASKSTLSREQVRAQLRQAPRAHAGDINPAA